MDQSRFDDITRSLAAPSRRSLLSLAGASAAAVFLGRDDAHARKKNKKKKKPKPCVENCAGKSCGDSNGCGGSCTACPAGKTCVNKQCIDDSCSPQCDGKDCGAADGCGGKCTRQQGCEANQTCVNGGCVAGTCSPACTSGQHCCDALGFGTLGCWNCCGDQDCVDNEVFHAQGKIICRSGGCNCLDEEPTLCTDFINGGNHCTNPLTDKDNCSAIPGDCGFRCPAGDDHQCCNGQCFFLPKCLTNSGGWTNCQTQHCGQCGSPCTAEFFGCCDGSCVDFRQDGNCGGCGVDCSTDGKVCCGGACFSQC